MFSLFYTSLFAKHDQGSKMAQKRAQKGRKKGGQMGRCEQSYHGPDEKIICEREIE
jgi:hypothetical protein